LGIGSWQYFTVDKKADILPLAVLGNDSIAPGFELEGRMNNYFDQGFWQINQLGPNIYIYNFLSPQ
jgi:hypothetical protein